MEAHPGGVCVGSGDKAVQRVLSCKSAAHKVHHIRQYSQIHLQNTSGCRCTSEVFNNYTNKHKEHSHFYIGLLLMHT